MDATIRSSAEGTKAFVLQSFKLSGQILNGVASFFLHWTLEPGYLRARRARMAATPPEASALGALDPRSVAAVASHFLSADVDADDRLARSALLPPQLLRAAREEFSWVSSGNRLEASGEFMASQPGTATTPGLVAEARIALLVLIDTAASQLLQCGRRDAAGDGSGCCSSVCRRAKAPHADSSIARAALGLDTAIAENPASFVGTNSLRSEPLPTSAGAGAAPEAKSRLLGWLPRIRISLPQDSLPPAPGSLSGAVGPHSKGLRRRPSALGGGGGELSALNSPALSPLLAPASGSGPPPMSLACARRSSGLTTDGFRSRAAADAHDSPAAPAEPVPSVHAANAAASAPAPLPFPTLPTPSAAFCPLPRISDVSTTAALLQRRLNLPVECFAAVTADGYVLTLIRIPRLESRRVVFFQHGLLDSASAWLSTGSVLSLAARAYAAGCDVFMGNLRGSNDALGSNGLGANPADYAELDGDGDGDAGGVGGSIAMQMQQMARAAQASAASAMAAAAAAASSAAASAAATAATAAATAAKALPSVSEGLQEAMTRVGSVASLAGLGSAKGSRESRDGGSRAEATPAFPLRSADSASGSSATGPVADGSAGGTAVKSVASNGEAAARASWQVPHADHDDDNDDDEEEDGDLSRAGGAFCRVRGQGVAAVGSRSRASSSASALSVSSVAAAMPAASAAGDAASVIGLATPGQQGRPAPADDGAAKRGRSASTASVGSIGSVGSVGFSLSDLASITKATSGASSSGGAAVGAGANEQPKLVSPLRGQLARSRTHVSLAAGDGSSSCSTVGPVEVTHSAATGADASAAASPPRIRRSVHSDASVPGTGESEASSAAPASAGAAALPVPPGIGGPTAAVRVAAALGTSAEGLPVHLHLHPRQQQFWAYDVTDHGLDIMAFMRQIRIIKAVEAPLRRRLRAAHANTAGGSAGSPGSSAAAASADGVADRAAASADGAHEDEEAELRRLTGGRPVDATSPLVDDCVITGVGHSMGGCVLLLHVLMSRALRRPHWLRKLVLLSPAGLHKYTPWPSKALLYALDFAGLLRAERPFPMRSSRLQRLGAHLLQDLKQMAGVGDLMAVAASYFFGGERFNFSFRHVSFTDYPIGGTSHRILRHGIQNVKARDFVPYNYGSRENRERYGAAKPPSIRDDFGLLADDGGVDISWIGGGLDLLVPPANLEEQHRLVLAIQRLASQRQRSGGFAAGGAGATSDGDHASASGSGGESTADEAAPAPAPWMRRGGSRSTMLTFPRAGHLDFSLTISDAIISHILEEIDSTSTAATFAATAPLPAPGPASGPTAAAQTHPDATADTDFDPILGLEPDVRDIAHTAVRRLAEYYADGGGSGVTAAVEPEVAGAARTGSGPGPGAGAGTATAAGGSGPAAPSRWRPARECALRHRWLFGLTKLDVALEALDAEAREMGLAPPLPPASAASGAAASAVGSV